MTCDNLSHIPSALCGTGDTTFALGAEMSLRRKFEKKVKEKHQEIQELEHKLMEARAYLEAMEDAMRLLPAEGGQANGGLGSDITVKPGTTIEAVVKALRASGKPIHIMELLK